jgi:glycosyltransferase involved in cell wall biosynthesis
MFSIRMEGWRFVPHSYALLCQWLCLELMRRDDVELFFRDVPFVRARWRQTRNLMPARWEEALARLGDSPATRRVDCAVRAFVPSSFKPSGARRVLVVCTADFGWLPTAMIEEGRTLAEAHRQSSATILSPSAWSTWGLLRAGADPGRVKLMPLGVDVNIFHPGTPNQREAERSRAGHADRFVFLNVSAHTLSKGTDLVLKAFARIAAVRDVFLVLKGADAVYESKDYLQQWMAERLTPEERKSIAGRMRYFGDSLSVEALAAVYRSADAYVTPYRSESFNMPALEAAACGLPVICTAGGPTDDFTTPAFARRIPAELVPGNRPHEVIREPDLDALTAVMLEVRDDAGFRATARIAGPAHCRSAFTWRHSADRLLAIARDARQLAS